MESDRITVLNDASVHPRGRYVLYWMQQSQRVHFNPALEYAILRANELGCPVVVVFALFEAYPEANERHFAFMLEGLANVSVELTERGIKFVIRCGQPSVVCVALAADAALVVCDRGYLRQQKAWYEVVARDAGRQVVQVEGDVVIPVERVSDKREYAARTIRPKINRLLESYVHAVQSSPVNNAALRLRISSDVDPNDIDGALARLNIDRSVGRVRRFVGGSAEARRRLRQFIDHALDGYGTARNDPAAPQCSNLSPYLHFGQISPLEMVLEVRAAPNCSADDRAVFLEELIVRRELAMNFVHYAPDYDRYSCLPPWAAATLARHRGDVR